MPDRVAALSEQLIHVHQALRDRLAALRQEAARQEAAVGTGPGAADAVLPENLALAENTALPEDLLSHFLSFCAAIHTHHRGENDQLWAALRAAAPELAPVIDNLIEDHGLVAGILRRIRELLAPGQTPSGPDALIRELDGLTAILESHFSYEERRIAKALDILGPQAWTADVFTMAPRLSVSLICPRLSGPPKCPSASGCPWVGPPVFRAVDRRAQPAVSQWLVVESRDDVHMGMQVTALVPAQQVAVRGQQIVQRHPGLEQ